MKWKRYCRTFLYRPTIHITVDKQRGYNTEFIQHAHLTLKCKRKSKRWWSDAKNGRVIGWLLQWRKVLLFPIIKALNIIGRGFKTWPEKVWMKNYATSCRKCPCWEKRRLSERPWIPKVLCYNLLCQNSNHLNKI